MKKLILSEIDTAKYFAIDIHGNQRYDKFPYIKHLEDVYKVLIRFEINDIDLLIAAFLHDAIEDGAASYNKIKNKFNINIAEIVYAVTDELGRNRKERHIKTYPKIQGFLKATILKLADRIANLEFSISKNIERSLFEMYQKEYVDFKSNLYIEKKSNDELFNKLNNMWKYLDKLMKYEN